MTGWVVVVSVEGRGSAFRSRATTGAALQASSSGAVQEWKLASGPLGSRIKVGRRQVPLREQMSPECASLLNSAVAMARIVDEGPASRRRYDLSGLRCDLSR